jgi:hypothetical protein
LIIIGVKGRHFCGRSILCMKKFRRWGKITMGRIWRDIRGKRLSFRVLKIDDVYVMM